MCMCERKSQRIVSVINENGFNKSFVFRMILIRKLSILFPISDIGNNVTEASLYSFEIAIRFILSETDLFKNTANISERDFH